MIPAFLGVLFAQTQAPATPAQPAGSPWATLLFPVLLMVAMYFLLIAPQRKRQKEHQKLISELKAGDEILTQGGIFGTIQQVKDDRFVLRLLDSSKVEVARDYVARVESRRKDDKS